MSLYRAAWVLPIAAPPIRGGWVEIAGGRVSRLGGPGQEPAGVEIRDLGQVAVLPGLVNAHTHLELSHLRGAIPPGFSATSSATSSFVAWVRQLMARRRAMPDPEDSRVVDGIADGIREALQTGTALVGDISNTLLPFRVLASSPLAALVFNELLGGFSVKDPDAFVGAGVERLARLEATGTVRSSLAAHAPYSVAPSVFQALRRVNLVPCSVHLAESPEEVEFLETGQGPWRALLEELGVWDESWVVPVCSPVAYLDRLGFIDRQTLVIHGVQMSTSDLAIVASHGATLVTCPRSNQYIGVGAPPIEAFYASGVRVAIGTDSLASVSDLNMFSEIAAVRALAPSVAASRLLASATREGAVALGFEGEFGEIVPGARARLLAVTLEGPAAAADVEEYLVSGIAPAQVRWVGEDA